MPTKTNQPESVNLMSNEYSAYNPNEEIDLIQLVINLKRHWKMIFAICVVGTLLSVVVALTSSKIYKTEMQIGLPTDAAVSKVAENGMKAYNQLELLKKYYDHIRFEYGFKEFVYSKGYLAELFPEVDSVVYADQLFAGLSQSLSVEIDEPKALKAQFIDSPTLFTVSLEHSNEALLVKLFSEYVEYTNTAVLSAMSAEQQAKRKADLTILLRDIDLLRKTMAHSRQHNITKLEAENVQSLILLEQKRQILIDLTANNRQTQIAIIEETNLQKLNQLEQKKELLVIKAKSDRAVQIKQTEEAAAIAAQLNIVFPTKLEDLDQDTQKKLDGQTYINLSNNQTLPMYLMGTNYLNTLIKTLKGRQDDALFMTELSQIDNEIELVKQDKVLQTLKARQSDAPFLVALNQIDNEISLIKNDLVLKELKERGSDDPYLEQLPVMQNAITRLNALSLDFSGIKAYSLVKAPLVTGRAIKPNRSLIVIIGASLSFFIAIMVALFTIGFQNRALRSAKNQSVAI